jgi:hypothetical protein
MIFNNYKTTMEKVRKPSAKKEVKASRSKSTTLKEEKKSQPRSKSKDKSMSPRKLKKKETAFVKEPNEYIAKTAGAKNKSNSN